MWERYQKIILSILGTAIVVGLVWGFATDWNFTSGRVLANASTPKTGDPCTEGGVNGTIQADGSCKAA